MSDLIKEDGWNKDNDSIQELLSALSDAQTMNYQLSNCTVDSTFGTAERLHSELVELIDKLTECAESIEGELD